VGRSRAQRLLNGNPDWRLNSRRRLVHGNCNCVRTTAGSYFNSLAAGVLQTSKGNSTSPAVATLTVTPSFPRRLVVV